MNTDFSFDQFLVSDDRHTVSLSYTLVHEGVSTSLTETFTFESVLPEGCETNQVARALHLACGISYYKIFMPPTFVHPYAMTEDEASFWNTVYRNGLGEFLYVNQLEPAALARFAAQEGRSIDTSEPMALTHKALLGIGGGKDSIVAGEVLKACRVLTEGFVLATGEARGQAQAVAQVMDVPLHSVARQLDQQLLALQQQPGAHQGHIPISLIFGLVGNLLALSQKASFVVVANEDSASTPQTTWAGEPVNHQWSKSDTFEGLLQDYLHTYVSPGLTYFSAIRPLGSVGIAKVFAKFPQYFEVFTSDNSVFRIDPEKRPNSRWSLESPKTLSSFILLSPWLDEPAMLKIFGMNVLEKSELSELFLSLIGLEGTPPLDCVGTPPELAASLAITLRQGKWQGSALLDLPEMIDLEAAPLKDFSQLSLHHHFPASLQKKLITTLKELAS